MTAQFPDTFTLEQRQFAIAGIKGEGLFRPQDLGLAPAPTCTACWRGYLCHYALHDGHLVLDRLQISLGRLAGREFQAQVGPEINGVRPAGPGGPQALFNNVYEGLDLGLPFSGGLLLGDDFIRELYVHMGFHPAWKYRTVRELLFEAGRLIENRDASEQIAQLRQRMTEQPLRPGPEGREDLRAWIESTFRLDYGL